MSKDNYYEIKIPIPKLTGYKTLIVNCAFLFFGLIAIIWPKFQAPDINTVDHLFNEINGIVVAVIGVLNILLRFKTKTPIMSREPLEAVAEPPDVFQESNLMALPKRKVLVEVSDTVLNYYAKTLNRFNNTDTLVELKKFYADVAETTRIEEGRSLWAELTEPAKKANGYLESSATNFKYPCSLNLEDKQSILKRCLDLDNDNVDDIARLIADREGESDEDGSDMVAPYEYDTDMPNIAKTDNVANSAAT